MNDRRQRYHLAAAICVASVCVTAAFGLVFPHLWYGLHQLSDVHVDYQYATNIARGQVPYRDFSFEYPPLALGLLLAPGHNSPDVAQLDGYQRWFSLEMFLLTLATGCIVVLTAHHLWHDRKRTYRAAVAFGLTAVALGAILENRFDVGAALVIALVILLLAARRAVVAAGAAVGLGIALKLTPAALLPLVAFVCADRRQGVRAVLAAGGVALAAYAPFLVLAPRGVLHSLSYHMLRPLQLESTLASPLLIWHLLGGHGVHVHFTYGSENVFGPGAGVFAAASGLLTLAAFSAVTILVWRRRSTIRHSPETIPLAAMGLVLSLVVFGKVLSPQYLVWLLPLAALELIDDLAVGLLAVLAMLATQIEFPGLYHSVVWLRPPGVLTVLCRNALLVYLFVVVVQRLRGMVDPVDAPEAASQPGTRLNDAAKTHDDAYLRARWLRAMEGKRLHTRISHPTSPAGSDDMKLRRVCLVIVLVAAGLAGLSSTATAASSSTHDPHPVKLARLSRLAWGPWTFGPSNPSGVALPTAPVPGWRQVFADDFKGSSLNKRNWSTYDGQPGHDTGAWFASTHDLVRGGLLVISAYRDPAHGDRWVTGGLTHNVGQTYGKFLVRMRRDRGVGISHALVLWPINRIWPPEIDLSEDNATNQRTNYATLHYGTAQYHHAIYRHIAVDLTKWHTWGVEWMPGKLLYTLDGRVWATVASSGVPASPMRLCLQTQSWAAGVDRWEGPTGPSTPRMVNMYVDWVVVYTRR